MRILATSPKQPARGERLDGASLLTALLGGRTLSMPHSCCYPRLFQAAPARRLGAAEAQRCRLVWLGVR